MPVSFSPLLLKFDFLVHTMAEVLLTIERMQDSGGMALSTMSIHTQIMEPRNSRRLVWARLRR